MLISFTITLTIINLQVLKENARDPSFHFIRTTVTEYLPMSGYPNDTNSVLIRHLVKTSVNVV